MTRPICPRSTGGSPPRFQARWTWRSTERSGFSNRGRSRPQNARDRDTGACIYFLICCTRYLLHVINVLGQTRLGATKEKDDELVGKIVGRQGSARAGKTACIARIRENGE